MRIASGIRYWLLQSGDGFLLPLVVLAFFWQLGAPALFDLDEGAFSAATWEMLQRQDFITTFLNGEPRFDKPVLIYWLQALSVSLFGLHEWALRLPSALAASAWVTATYGFAKPRMILVQARLATLMLATSAMVVLIGRAATADALLNLLIALSLFDIWRYWEQAERKVLFRVFLWLGLGFLTKGPIALAVPLAVSAFLYLRHGRWREWLRVVTHPGGWIVLLAVAAPWYVMEYLAQGQAFIDGFFFRHNLSRFSATMEGHGGHLGYYVLVLPLVILPFTGLLFPWLAGWKRWPGTPFQHFLLAWFLVVFGFFSFSGTQLPHYLLYGITPLLLLLAMQVSENPNRWLTVLPAVAVAVVWLLLPEVLGYLAGAQPDGYRQGMLEQAHKAMGMFYRAAAAIYLLALLLLLLWPRVRNLWRLVGVAVLQTLFLGSVLIPVIAYAQQGAVKEAARFARHYLTDATVVMDALNMPSFTVYREAITPARAPQPGEYVFTTVEALQPAEAFVTVFRQGGLVLAKRVH